MRKQSYLLLCAISLVLYLSSAAASPVVDSIYIEPDLDSIIVCPGGEVTLSVVGGTNYNWFPAADFDDPNGDTVTLTPSASQWYYVTGIINAMVSTDSIYVTIPEFSVQVTQDTVCPYVDVPVTFVSNTSISEVLWNTVSDVEDPASTTGTIIRPRNTREYIITVTTGGCTLSDTFTVHVIPFIVELISPDTVFICLGDTGTIRHTLQPPGVQLVWTPLDSTIEIQSATIASVFPTISASYTATAMFEGCILSTTTFVRVDSLPDTSLVVIPLRDPYCAGEEVTIFAERADTFKYPDIMFQWFPMDGQIQDSTNTGNVFVILQDTTEFFRVMVNNACRDTSSVTLNVIPPDLPLSVMDTTLCPGDMFVVEILDPDISDIEWMPTQGLSCADCINPTVTVQANPITYMVSAMKDRCTVSGMLSVSVFPPLDIPITPSSALACPGDEVAFTIDTSGLSNMQISISGGSITCNDCPDPVVTYDGDILTITVTADETSDMHCGARGIATISMKPDEEQQLAATIVCANEATTIPLGQFGFVNPSISINVGTVSCTNCENPVVTIPQTTTLIIDSDSPNPGACRLRSTMTLLVPAGDMVDFTLVGEPYGQGEIATITLTTEPPASAGTQYEWTVNGMSVPGNTATIMAAMNQDSNIVHVEWINSFGCPQSADIGIGTIPPEHKIPKAFTPNRELNSHFRVHIDGNIEITEMLVFNRWGQVVYDGTDLQGWDGRREGEIAPPGVYAYLIKLRYPDGKVVLEKGDVTLIR